MVDFGDAQLAAPEFIPPVFDHAMIDIESMSLSPHNALILSIGMLEFDPAPFDRPVFGSRSLILPSIVDQLALGREISESTQSWWKGQKPEARAHWLNPDAERYSLPRICACVQAFCQGKTRVWANGTQFDLSNINELNRQMKPDDRLKELWHYQSARDMRTFCRETVQTRIVPIGDALDIKGVPHEPVYDCEVQAWQVWAHWQDH